MFLTLMTSCLLVSKLVSSSSESIGEGFCDNDDCKLQKKCHLFDISSFGPTNKSIIFGEARGRIGNQLLGYAIMYQLRKQLDVDAFINLECKDVMSHTFTEDFVEVPVYEETFCNPEDIPLTPYHGSFAELLTNEKYRRGHLINFYPADPKDYLKGGYRPEDHIGPEQDGFQTAYVKHLKKKLKFRPEIQKRVNKTFKKMAKKMGLKTKDVTFVGIHNRRTDHFSLVKKTTGQPPLTKDYFYDAMEYFRDEYENVAFGFVSDDMAWARKNLKNKHNDLFFVGASEDKIKKDGQMIPDPDAPVFDLALLIQSNHTIISRGTYSMWAAVLCNGEYYTEYGSIVPVDLQ